jgi:prolycopene isomerase
MSLGKYDVIIIGAGIGGLVCGALLAKKGLRVLILEKNSKPGGYCSSFKRDDFIFDACVHSISGCGENGILSEILKEIGIKDRIKFYSIDPYDKVIFPDISISIPQDIEEYIQKLCGMFPEESVAICDYFKELAAIFRNMVEIPFRAKDFLKVDVPKIFKYRNQTFKDILDRCFRNQKLKKILGSQWGYAGLSPSYVSALYMTIVLMSYHIEGAFYPEGGVQVLPDSISKRFLEFGGELRVNSLVEKIIVKDNGVSGIGLQDKEEISADIIVSNADAKVTLLQLIKNDNVFSKRYLQMIRTMKETPSAFCVYLGVDMDLKGRELGKCNYWIHDNCDYDIYYRYIMSGGEIDGRGGIFVSVPSLKDPRVFSTGKHIVSLVSLTSYYNDWDKIKDRVADILIKKASQLFPGLVGYIIKKEIATPKTLQRFTLSPEGAMYGFASTPEQFLMYRPKNKSPLERLYLVGQSTYYGGGGVLGAALSGYFTSKMIINSLN